MKNVLRLLELAFWVFIALIFYAVYSLVTYLINML